MKKMLIIVLIALTGIIVAHPFEAYHEYAKNQSNESFVSAYVHYITKVAADSMDFNAQLATAYLHYSELARIMKTMKENTELSPPNMFRLANLYLALKEYDVAIEIYNKVNEEMPEWSCPWRHKGEAFMKDGKLDKAEESLKTAVKYSENHFDAWVMLADVQLQMKKKKNALESIRKAENVYGKDTEKHQDEELSFLDYELLKLKILKANKKKKDWITEHKILLEKYPENIEIKNLKY